MTTIYLSKDAKESIGLLSIGTFLEYFDLLLFVHLAVVLNEVFFPKADPFTASLYTAAAFCTTYIARLGGAWIFGWIGDNMGRKFSLTLTTLMMAISCLIIAVLPTYDRIGIAATWAIVICRIIQGMASTGERIGAEIYLTEIIRPPFQYPVVASIAIFSTLGGTAALGAAKFVFKYNLNWRILFILGAFIAIIGVMARIRLKETNDFEISKKQHNKLLEEQLVNKAARKEILNLPIYNYKIFTSLNIL